MFALNDCGDELDHINSIQMLYKYTGRLHRCYHNYYYTKQVVCCLVKLVNCSAAIIITKAVNTSLKQTAEQRNCSSEAKLHSSFFIFSPLLCPGYKSLCVN